MLAPSLVLLAACGLAAGSLINGTTQTCENEGEPVPADAINVVGVHCFSCMCTNGRVQCQPQECPSHEGCHVLVDDPRNNCCRRICKGCVHEGVEHPSGSEWRDAKDPCTVFRCEAGIVTESQIRCHAPCRDPLPPAAGQCCATCPGCQLNGRQVSPGSTVRSSQDACVECRCGPGGRLSCEKRACPVLQCPRERRVRPAGECCARCVGSRALLLPPAGRCLVGMLILPPPPPPHRSVVSAPTPAAEPDPCTTCRCHRNGTAVCHRQVCPVLDCPEENQELPPPGRCCGHCRLTLPSHASCTAGNITRQDGDVWQPGPCHSCECRQGQVRCVMQMCPQQNVPCPPNYKLEHKANECCPRCVESDGVCTVFGDPHYRTFDGKFYSFQGSCKYQLASDCVTHTFGIRVTNDARATKASSWTKTISMKIGELKINLGQNMRVKVNGKRVQPPYRLLDKISVNKTRNGVQVETFIGVKIVWDGNSFLEVSVPKRYKGKMCGLCGNFNRKASDDFTLRHGGKALDTDAERFGLSWRVGGTKSCTRPQEQLNREPQCQKPKVHQRSVRQCAPLKEKLFNECHKKLNPNTYYQACIVDMCECPTGRCHCESFMAYAHECQRLGVRVHKWRKASRCLSFWASPRKRPPLRKLQ
ncbi:BMP-binding endothelial regulator protein [Schistocerca cancellata]|uniref:BMP-binding endothelial regulator protein n=1 Tax=Schistocerca cancellata TaxID=274614 RepID=UPI002118D40F|nr:BMP-binding endothelial regulator protein [Schistocerca cancellata]